MIQPDEPSTPTDDPHRWAERAHSFGSAAATYDRGRPSYPLPAVRWAIGGSADGSGWDGPPPHRVLDLAAGTGKLTRALLALGLEVVAVEPSAEMRALVPDAATVLAGTAEQIPLDDRSVDAVVAGQAWHWFDATRATAEVARVLRPGGFTAALWNLSDGSDDLTARYAATVGGGVFADHRPQSGPPWPADGPVTGSEHATFPSVVRYDADRLVAYAASTSKLILEEPKSRQRILDEVRGLAPEGEFDLHEVCVVWRGHT